MTEGTLANLGHKDTVCGNRDTRMKDEYGLRGALWRECGVGERA